VKITKSCPVLGARECLLLFAFSFGQVRTAVGLHRQKMLGFRQLVEPRLSGGFQLETAPVPRYLRSTSDLRMFDVGESGPLQPPKGHNAGRREGQSDSEFPRKTLARIPGCFPNFSDVVPADENSGDSARRGDANHKRISVPEASTFSQQRLNRRQRSSNGSRVTARRPAAF